jgi:transcriptional regulator with XRE-family HTH domain
VDNILNTITAYRKERKWSLYDLATHAGMKSITISTWYNNSATPSIPSLVKICDAF